MTANKFIQSCFSNEHSTNDYMLLSSEVVDSFIATLKSKYKINIVCWDTPRLEYPQYMFLGGDRGILAYLTIDYTEKDTNYEDAILSMPSAPVLGYVTKAVSHLDRPVFFVHIINTKDIKGIYFETNEQIKDRWFSTNFDKQLYTPFLQEMGDITNLLSIFSDLKKNNVRL